MATFGETQKRLNLQEQSQRLIGESAVKNHQVFSEQDSEKGKPCVYRLPIR